MHPYILLLGACCVVNALCAGLLVSRHRAGADGGITAALHLGAAWWGLCEVAWNLAPDAQTALAWMRVSAPGWIFVGPLVLHSFIALEGGPTRLRRAIPFGYALAGVFLFFTWSGSSMMSGAVRTSWGWGYTVGGLYTAFFVATLALVGGGYTLLESLLSSNLDADRRQRPVVVAGMLIPLGVASTTDVLLPILGVQVPRLGTSSFALLGVLTVSNVLRFGYSVIVPSNFSNEILATLSEGVALVHANGRIRSANDGLGRLAGRNRAELERMEIGELLECDFDRVRLEVHQAEGRLRHANGSEIPVALTSRTVRDRQGNALGVVVTVHDLREIESLRTRLVASDRLAAVGHLAAGIAHEINNPLAFVRANLSQLEAHWKHLRDPLRTGDASADELRALMLEAGEMIEESLEGVDRAAEIIRGIRGFSHAGGGEREPANLNELLEQALLMATPRLRGRVEVERRFAELPLVSCVPQQVKQVFVNLIVNAEQAIGDQGTILLETERGEGFVAVSVVDDGPGIPEEVQTRIFDPFFTTKGVGEGTGLGLGIALEIVHGHGGSIEAFSEPGCGARFRVRLPVIPDDD